MAGLKDDRRALIGAGLSILRAIFELLEIDQMQMASAGLRHGLLAELMGRPEDSMDLRTRSVQRLANKFEVDADQAERVGKVAQFLFEQINPRTAMSGGLKTDWSDEKLLSEMNWAAQLHEIGSHIAHTDSHKHGHYIIGNCDAIGFTMPELHRLSLLVLGHRGKLRKLIAHLHDANFLHQLLALRLAVILCHARRDPQLPGLTLAVDTHCLQGFVLGYQAGWEKAFPQSAHLLREEMLAWQKTPWTLTINALNFGQVQHAHFLLPLEQNGFPLQRY